METLGVDGSLNKYGPKVQPLCFFSLEEQNGNCVLGGEIHQEKESTLQGEQDCYFPQFWRANTLTISITSVNFLTISSLDPVTALSKGLLCSKAHCILWEAPKTEERCKPSANCGQPWTFQLPVKAMNIYLHLQVCH